MDKQRQKMIKQTLSKIVISVRKIIELRQKLESIHESYVIMTLEFLIVTYVKMIINQNNAISVIMIK